MRSPRSGSTGICPHCRTGVRFESASITAFSRSWDANELTVLLTGGSRVNVASCSCPICGLPIVSVVSATAPNGTTLRTPGLVFPAGAQRPLPAEVASAAPTFVADFQEAVAVLPMSRKASAALSRRCLQFILVDAGKVTKRDLADQIEEILPRLPHEIAQNVDAIRQVGNFAAHPTKSTNSGAVVDVEEGEAEWLLDVLEELADHFYVAPARAAAKRSALNQKLAEIRKPPLKQP